MLLKIGFGHGGHCGQYALSCSIIWSNLRSLISLTYNFLNPFNNPIFFPLMGLLTNDGQKFVPIVPLTVMAAFGLLFLPK